MSETRNREEVKTLTLNIDEALFQKALKACRLENHQQFSKADQDLLSQYQELVANADQKIKEAYDKALNNDQSPSEILAEIAKTANPTKSAAAAPNQEKKTQKRGKAISLFDLMQEGQKLTGKPITLSRGQELLAVSGLSEQGEYQAEEAERFLQACDLTINQGKSLADVAQANGVVINSPQSPLEWARETGSNQVQDFDRLAEQNAQLGAQITTVYQQAYFASLQHYFTSGKYERHYTEAQARIREKEGPSPFEQFNQQYQLWQAQQDPLARIQAISRAELPMAEEDGKTAE